MDSGTPLSSETSVENVINILVIKQDDYGIQHAELQHPVLERSDPLVVSSVPTKKRVWPPDLSSSDVCSKYLDSQSLRTPNVLTKRRTPLYKSQSFTVSSNRSNDGGPSFEVLCTENSPLHVLVGQKTPETPSLQSKQKENKITPFASSTPLSSHTDGRRTKLVKYKTVSLPINNRRGSCNMSNHFYISTSSTLSPLILNDLTKSSIENLIATPDSGFCTPSFENMQESLLSSAPASPASTPRTSHLDRKGETEPNTRPFVWPKDSDAGEVLSSEEESPLDKSLESVQWLGAYSIGDTVKPLMTTPPDEPLKATSISPSSEEVQVTTAEEPAPPVITRQLAFPSMTPLPVIMATPLPSFNLSVVTSGSGFQGTTSATCTPCNPQKRRALEELHINKCQGIESHHFCYERPSYSYMDLIKMALKHSEDGQMTLREILSWIESHFPYFKHRAKQSWKSSIRHNLSLHPDFIKVEDKKHGGKWKMVDNAKKYIHRIPKPPVVKQPVGPRVSAYTPKTTRRSVPQPILPKATVPYALVPIPLVSYGQQAVQQLMVSQPQQAITVPFPNPLPLQQPTAQQFPPPKLNPHLSQYLPQEGCQEGSQPLLPNPSVQSEPSLQQLQQQQEQPYLTTHKSSRLVSQILLPKPSPHVDSSSLSVGASCSLETNREQISGSRLGSKQKSRLKRSIVTKVNNVSSQKITSRSKSQDFVYQPMNIEIHEGSNANEKKIIFHLKQFQEQPTTSNLNSQQGAEQTQPDSDALLQSLKSRAFHKLVDKLQRSNSFGGGGGGCSSAYTVRSTKGGSSSSKSVGSKKAPVLNLECILKEDRRAAETIGKILLEEDVAGQTNAASNYKGVSQRNESASLGAVILSKSIIEQAWNQAGTFSEAAENRTKSPFASHHSLAVESGLFMDTMPDVRNIPGPAASGLRTEEAAALIRCSSQKQAVDNVTVQQSNMSELSNFNELCMPIEVTGTNQSTGNNTSNRSVQYLVLKQVEGVDSRSQSPYLEKIDNLAVLPPHGVFDGGKNSNSAGSVQHHISEKGKGNFHTLLPGTEQAQMNVIFQATDMPDAILSDSQAQPAREISHFISLWNKPASQPGNVCHSSSAHNQLPGNTIQYGPQMPGKNIEFAPNPDVHLHQTCKLNGVARVSFSTASVSHNKSVFYSSEGGQSKLFSDFSPSCRRVLSLKDEVYDSAEKETQVASTIPTASSRDSCQYFQSEVNLGTTKTLKEGQRKDETDLVAGSKPMSASRLVFPNSSLVSSGSLSACSITTTTNPAVTTLATTLGTSVMSSSGDQGVMLSTSKSSQQPRFFRNKSRRKQVHVPLKTEVSPYRDKESREMFSHHVMENDSTSDIHATPTNKSLHFQQEVGMFATSLCGTESSRALFCSDHTTSGPNLGHIPALDFAAIFQKYMQQSSPADTSFTLPRCDNTKPLSPLPVTQSSLSPQCRHPLLSFPPAMSSLAGSISSPEVNYNSHMLKETSFTSDGVYLPVLASQVTLTESTLCMSSPCLSGASFQCSPPSLLTHSPNTSHHTLSEYLSLTSTPPAGSQQHMPTTPLFAHSTDAGPPEMFHVASNSSSFLDNSLFDNLESFMQNSFSETRTPP